MAERTSYAPGTPSWVDLGSPDTAAAARFYGSLFGWELNDLGQDAGGYGMFTLRGKYVAGLGPQTNQQAPPYWTVYVSVADADAAAASVTSAGGKIVAGPMDVFEAGRMAAAQDSGGAFISLWQPKEHLGAQLVNEPGTFTWCELAAGDIAQAREFYAAAFGWEVQGDPHSETAAIFAVGGKAVCGAHAAGPEEPRAWSVWFAVTDCDASAARAAELGGSVLMPPTDMDFGRGAVLADPHGAVFGVGVVTDAAQDATT